MLLRVNIKCVIPGLLGLQNGVMPDLRDMTQLKRKREVEEETEKSESSLEEDCKRFRSQYVSPQVEDFVIINSTCSCILRWYHGV